MADRFPDYGLQNGLRSKYEQGVYDCEQSVGNLVSELKDVCVYECASL